MRVVIGEDAKRETFEVAKLDDIPLWATTRLNLYFAQIEHETGVLLDMDTVFDQAAYLARGGEVRTDLRYLLVGILVWMTRMANGERINYEDANDFPTRTIGIELTEKEKADAEAEEKAAAEQALRTAAVVEASGAGVRPTSPASAPE